MSDSLDMQRRYFTSQLDNLRKAPSLNAAKIADCEHYLQVLEEAGSLARFMDIIKQTGNMVSTSKAESRDRYGNRAFIYRKLGQERKEAADMDRLSLIDETSTHTELAQSLEAFEEQNEAEFQENKAIMAIGSLIKAVFHLATDPPGSAAKTRNLSNVETYWKMLREADSEASWERIITYRPYRDRIIFTNEQLALLEPVFREVCNG